MRESCGSVRKASCWTNKVDVAKKEAHIKAQGVEESVGAS